MKEFAPFRLDIVNECLWRRRETGDSDRVSLTPKAFAVLKYLLEHAGRLVTHNELLETAWPDTYVQPEVLKSQILAIRRALGDDTKQPKFIETLPRRGYRFIAPVTDLSASLECALEPSGQLVGRTTAFDHLNQSLQMALQGRRQVVFITGEMGIGKTTVVEEFLRCAADIPNLRLGHGQCVEGFGSKEAYYPMLEALGQLCSGSGGSTLLRTLATQAPTWLVQFPAFVKNEQRDTLQREILGATRERMLREISEALETITSKEPLLLVLEDLHWVDPSTIDLISALARRRAPAKLMLICTYRPVDVALAGHPLKAVKQDLLVHQLCREIALEPLNESDVAEYLAIESQGAAPPEALAKWIYRYTEGNPLFMVAALKHLQDQGLIAQEDGAWHVNAPLEKIDLAAPDTLRHMIEIQIERLSPEEREVLEVASVLRKFSLAVTIGAAVANLEPDVVERLLDGVARRYQMIRRAGFREYRNGPSACYEFTHVLYRQVLYSRIGPERRRKLHRRMAENGEALRLLRGVTMDTELAYQFEEGGDWLRAVKYLLSAADMAGRRFEPQQAADILEHALELVNKISEAERAQSEIEVLQKLCTIYSTSFDPRALKTYEMLVARADHYGMAEVEVHALLEMAFPLALLHPDLYMKALDRAHRAQSAIGEADPLQRAAMRALYICRRMGAGKWDPGNIDDCEGIIAQLQEAGDRHYLGEVQMGFGFALFNRAQYRRAQRNSEEGFAAFLHNNGQNPYLDWHFQLHRHLVCSCHLLLGEWGAALQTFDHWAELSDRNSDLHSAMIARLERTELQIQAMDFAGAQQILNSALAMVTAMPRIRRYWLNWAGSAERGLGNYDRALEYLLRCRDDMTENPMVADWYHRMVLQKVLAEVWLSKGELSKARTEADQFLALTLTAEEHTFRALAYELNARLAIAEGNFDRSQDDVAKAVHSMEGYELPLAHWRVHATAAELYERKGNTELAEYHLTLSRDTVMKLANSLPQDEPLRKTFLSAPIVRNILGSTTTAVA